jgi:hypothetical protein
MTYIKPTAFAKSYTCPHLNCGAIAKQDWQQRKWADYTAHPDFKLNPLRIGTCQHCGQSTVWVFDVMVYPDSSTAPHANPDMPEDVLLLYNEAASIVAKSPRGAAALLRLAIQKLCIHLGEPGENINTDIGSLVKKGLPARIQQSLDIVRITGNNAVHPGEINVDEPDVTENLFKLLNVIVEYTISMPKNIDGVFNTLPEGSLKAIEARDKPKP